MVAPALRILGIDPGYGRCGWGVLDVEGNRLLHVAHGVWEPARGHSFSARLVALHGFLREAVAHWTPQEAAVEELFFSKNVKTAIDVGQARGVLLLGCALAGLRVEEYKPAVVKQAVTGHGQADKRQVQRMVKILLALRETPKPDDAADALAVAICHAQSRAWRRLR